MPERKIEVIITGDNKSGPAFGALHSDLDKTEKKAGGVGSMLGGLGTFAAVGAVATVAAVGAIGLGLFKLGEEFDSVFDTIRTKTGATGTILDGLKDDFKAVAADVPADFGVIGTVLADLNVRTGLTGESLQLLSKNIIEMSRLTGTEAAGNVALATRLFGDWSVATDSQAGMLDKMFRASQVTGIGVDALMGKVVQFGAPLRQMGFGLEESMAMLGKWEKEGVNSELVLGSLRIALGNFAREGVPVREGLLGTIEAIKGAGDASKANALAMEVFGARAGPDMAAAIREGRFELGNLLDTIENGGETILGAARDTEDFAEKWQRFTNRAKIALEPLSSAVFGFAGTILDELAPALETGIEWFTSFASYIGAVVDDGDTLNDWLDHLPGPLRILARGFGELVVIGGNVIGMVRGLGDRLGDLWRRFSESSRFQAIIHLFTGWAQSIGAVAGALAKGDIGGALGRLWTGIKTWLLPLGKNILGALGDIYGGIFKWLQDQFKKVTWGELWKGAVGLAAGIWGVALNVAGWVKEQFSNIPWADIWTGAGNIWAGLTNTAGDLLGALGGLKDKAVSYIAAHAKEWADTFSTWTVGAWDWVSSAGSALLGALGGFLGEAIGYVVAHAAEWGDTLLTWTVELWEWVGKAKDNMLAAIGDLAAAGQKKVVEETPGWEAAVQSWVTRIADELGKINWKDTFGNIGKKAGELIGTALTAPLQIAAGVIETLIGTLMDTVKGTIRGKGTAVNIEWGSLWDGFKDIVGGVFGTIWELVSNFYGSLVRTTGQRLGEVNASWTRTKVKILADLIEIMAMTAKAQAESQRAFTTSPPSLAPIPGATETYGPFATGGSFTVPGLGGIDSQRVAFHATPGERVIITPPGATTNSRNTSVNIGGIEVNIASGSDWATIKRMVLKEVNDRLDEAQRRAGFGGSIVTTGAFTP